MKRSLTASILAAGLMAQAAGPMLGGQTAYPPQQQQYTRQQQYTQQQYAQQQYQQQYHKDHRDRNKRIKHGVIGGAIGAGAGALLGGGAGAAIGAAAGGATGALWPTHHHDH